MKKLAPIVLFVYNRPEHTKATLNALKKNKLAQESELFIFSDGAKNQDHESNVKKVREIIHNVECFKNVTLKLADSNKGLAKSIIEGVNEILESNEKVIVLEDDLMTSKYFLTYMNDALNYYKNDESVWSISGYAPKIEFPNDYEFNIYKTMRACSWGWGTWKDKWKEVDWEVTDYEKFKQDKRAIKEFNKVGNELAPMLDDQMNGRIDSWAVRWYYAQFKDQSYTIYPRSSFVDNRGFKGDSTHGSISSRFDTTVTETYDISLNDVPVNREIVAQFTKYFDLRLVNYVGRLLRKIGLYKVFKKLYIKIFP